MKERLRAWMDNPVALGRFSGWECLFWSVASFPIVIWFQNSIPLLVFISVYAIIRTSFSDWQGYKAEQRALQHEPELIEKINEITPDREPDR